MLCLLYPINGTKTDKNQNVKHKFIILGSKPPWWTTNICLQLFFFTCSGVAKQSKCTQSLFKEINAKQVKNETIKQTISHIQSLLMRGSQLQVDMGIASHIEIPKRTIIVKFFTP